MTRIYLIRHGEAEGNRYRRIQGWKDASLTPLGRRQLAPLRERFRDVALDAVYSSDLLRAQETARAVLGERALPLRLLTDLREQCMGAWEDECWGWAAEAEPEQLAALNSDPAKFTVPGAENYDAVLARLRRALTQIAAENPGGTAAAASHGCAIRILLADLLGHGSAGVREVPHCDNTAVAALDWEGDAGTVVYYNDNSHLPAELSPFAREKWWQNTDWKDGRDLYFRPMELWSEEGRETYLRRYRETWIVSHGSDRGFSELFLTKAQMTALGDRWAVVEVMAAGTPCGMLELSPHQGEEEGAGHIALLYLEEAFRGKGLGTQLIGQAVSHYRRLGRRCLRLRAAETNGAALRFYAREGFTLERIEEGSICPNHVLVKAL